MGTNIFSKFAVENQNLAEFMSISHVGLDLLIETSWEVCNKVGGIYTVLSTKAKTLQSMYKDKVIFIGGCMVRKMSHRFH